MKRIALTVAVALAGCGGEDCPPTLAEGAAYLYRIDEAGVTCGGAFYRADAENSIACGWECVTVNGRLARYIFVDFAREDAAAPWRPRGASVEFSRTDECH